MNNLTLQKMEELVKPKYDRLESWAHAWLHVESVANTSEELAKIVDADPFLCVATAYCHDLGRVVDESGRGKQTRLENDGHANSSIGVAENILKKYWD